MPDMDPWRKPAESRGLTAVDGAIALIAVLLLVQMWLLSATLEEYLAGHTEGVVPATVFSAVLFAGCGALYWFIRRVDDERRRR